MRERVVVIFFLMLHNISISSSIKYLGENLSNLHPRKIQLKIWNFQTKFIYWKLRFLNYPTFKIWQSYLIVFSTLKKKSLGYLYFFSQKNNAYLMPLFSVFAEMLRQVTFSMYLPLPIASHPDPQVSLSVSSLLTWYLLLKYFHQLPWIPVLRKYLFPNFYIWFISLS